jgi:hypothetical protein
MKSNEQMSHVKIQLEGPSFKAFDMATGEPVKHIDQNVSDILS